jgi:hypothetical protein
MMAKSVRDAMTQGTGELVGAISEPSEEERR